jgi:hypothetical protein
MAVLPTTSYRGRSYSRPLTQPVSATDHLASLNLALSTPEGHKLLELLAAQLKASKFIDQTVMTPHDFDLSDGAHEVMYVTCRMGARQELVFKIGPGTLMRHAIDRCLETWRHPEGRRYMAWELFFYLPCNTRIDYFKPMTAKEVCLLSLWG